MPTPAVQLNVRIPPALAGRIARASAAAGKSQQQTVIDALTAGLPPVTQPKAKGEHSQ